MSAFRPPGVQPVPLPGVVSLSLRTRLAPPSLSPPAESPYTILRSERKDGKVCWMVSSNTERLRRGPSLRKASGKLVWKTGEI